MAKSEKKTAKETKSRAFQSSEEKTDSIIGLILMVSALLLFLSIVSYSPSDIGFIRSGSVSIELPEEGAESAPKGQINNWMNIAGAYTAHFFVHNTLGYFSLFLPLLIGYIGFTFFSKRELFFVLKISASSMLAAVMGASLFGVFRLKFEGFYEAVESSGYIGLQLASLLDRAIGGAGAVIALLTGLLILAIYVFNVSVKTAAVSVKEKLSELRDKAAELRERNKNADEDEEPEEEYISQNELLQKQAKPKAKKPLKEEQLSFEDDEVIAIIPDEGNKKKETKININLKQNEAAAKSDADTAKEEKPVRNDKPAKKEIKPKTSGKEEEEVSEFIKQLTGESQVYTAEGEKGYSPADEPAVEVDREKEVRLPEPWEEKINYKKPSLDLLMDPPKQDFKIAEEELKKNAEQLKEKLALFQIEIENISVTPGPVVTMYEIVPAPGVKISRIVNLENDIALALAARGIRIIAPIPGRSVIGVEIPNADPSIVVAKDIIAVVGNKKAEIPLALGKDIVGNVIIADLAKMPHLLVAGSTGSGKSVGINMMITSLLYAKHPSEVKLVIIDPKKVELSFYNMLRHHYLAVSPDLNEDIITTPQNAIVVLNSVVAEMEKRFDMLAKAGVRNIVDYNVRIADPVRAPKSDDNIKHHFMPYIVVVVDELADLMITSGKEVEEPITRLAQLARAVGIHLILATQRPSVNVITGLIKANFPARIAYQVATKIDSRTILDMNGAEQLIGRGDMLFLPNGTPKPMRVQNAFISTDEVENVTNFINGQKGYSKPYYLPSVAEKKAGSGTGTLADMDALFEDAARIVVQAQQCSVSFLQRRLKLGYARAARIVDQLEDTGIVGPGDGAKPRQVIVDSLDQLEAVIRTLI
ncbi:MAG: DNA translocase FtsK [Ignavibacteriaceae bacterium]|nr:DNA translocase FtsK [Ignavibacteriaceae bacterium]